MNLEARLYPEKGEWNACLEKKRYFSGGISTGNNLHFVFSLFNTLFQLTCALCRMTWKLMGYSFIFHPLDSLGPFTKTERGSLLMAEIDFEFFEIPLTC